MNKKTKIIENPEFAAVDAALKRATKSAHILARKTKTPCYIWQDGSIVNITAQRKGRKSDRFKAIRKVDITTWKSVISTEVAFSMNGERKPIQWQC